MKQTELPLTVAVRQFGQRCAYRDGNVRINYAQLGRDVEARRSQLISAGLQLQDRVAWMPRNDYATLINFWSILHARAIACPLSYRLPESKRQEYANQLRAKWLDDFNADSTTETENTPPTSPDLTLPATIILSSGSTGVPKAIVHSMSAHVASAQGAAEQIPLAPGDAWLWALPAFHVGGLSIPIRCAIAGATVCGVDTQVANLAHWLTETQASHVSLVPTQLRRLLDRKYDFSQIKAALVGGMAVPPVLIDRALQNGVRLHTTYGLTEMASQVTTSGACETPTTSSGAILSHRELRIAPDGEILVRGKTLCLGYAIGEDIKKVTNEQGWFHTRDRGRLTPTGELEVLGRIDNMFISGGENVYPESIEQEVLRLEGVKQAIVVPRIDAEFGKRPVCFVEAETIDGNRWNTSLRERLAGYQLPIAYLPWPSEARLAIKPDRKELQRIANESG